MDFGLTEEQKMLRTTALDFLSAECPKTLVRELEAGELGYSPALWQKMADLGWLGVAIPQQYGGFGGSLLDLAIIFEEVGRAACPSPLFSTVVLGAFLLLEAGGEEQKTLLLPKLAEGQLLLTLALTEPEADYDPRAIATTAVPDGGGFRIDGTKMFVQNAHVSDYLLVVARTAPAGTTGEGLSTFLVPKGAAGLSLEPLATTGGDKQFIVRFAGVVVPEEALVGPLNGTWASVDRVLRIATAIQCAELVGITEQALEMTTRHTAARIQFDRPIGSFQAVQMRLANMLVDVEGARWTAYQAVCSLAKGLPAVKETAIAKAWAADAAPRIAVEALRLHGGLGIDTDYDLHFYYRRAKANELILGAAPFHRKVLAAMLTAEPVAGAAR